MDEQPLTILARLCHLMMHEYVSPRGAYHVHDGHMAQFSMLCDYIEQGRSKQLQTHRKFKKLCGCL
jgi:hypothetical protein